MLLLVFFFVIVSFFFFKPGVEIWLSMELLSLWVGLCIINDKSSIIMYNSLKYLILQMLMGALVLLGIYCENEVLLLVSISFKLGVVPSCMWVVDIFSSFSLFYCWLLSTVSKFMPLVVLWIYVSSNCLYYVVILSVFFGSFWGLNFGDFRQIMACSSIVNTGWIVSFVISDNFYYLMTSFMMYVVFVSFFFIFMKNINIYSDVSSQAMSWIFFSLMGLPCFVVFYIKILVVLVFSSYWYVFFTFLSGYSIVIMYMRMFNYSFISGSCGINQIKLNNFWSILVLSFSVMLFMMVLVMI